MVQVLEEFRWLNPRADYRATVERLLRFVPPEYLEGLDRVCLKDTAAFKDIWPAISRGTEPRGLYWRAWKGRKAYIELNLDAITATIPGFLQKLPLFRELVIVNILYHEVGHHIQLAIEPDPRPTEVVANIWRDQLGRIYVRRRFRYLRPIRLPLLWFVRALRRLTPALKAVVAWWERMPKRKERRTKERLAHLLHRRQHQHPPRGPSARAGSPRERRRHR